MMAAAANINVAPHAALGSTGQLFPLDRSLAGVSITRMTPTFRKTLCCAVLLAVILPLTEARASDGIRRAGDALTVALPTAAAGMALYLRDWDGAKQLALSEGATFGVTYILKYGIDARRPNGGDLSFPSYHTSSAFASAEYLRKRYGWEYGVPAYAAASFVAYSRVESSQHYAHDVIVGAGIGILSSYLLTRPYDGWNLQLQGDTRSYGFQLGKAW